MQEAPVIAGFCKRDAIPTQERAFMFYMKRQDRDFAVLDVGADHRGIFMVVTDAEWEAHRIVMKPTPLVAGGRHG